VKNGLRRLMAEIMINRYIQRDREAIMSIMSDMAKNELCYKGKKPIQLTLDPASFVGEDGKLDSAAMAHEMFEWAQKQFKKIDSDKAEAEGKKDG
jgi:hypothetical protein